MAGIYILTEGGGSLGMGHISRCLSLCQAFEMRGFTSRLIVDAESPLKVDFSGIDHLDLNWIKEADKVISVVEGADIIIIDSYRAPKEIYDKIASVGSLSAFIDDDIRIDYPPGVIINGVMCAESFAYPSKEGRTCLLGHQYSFLRKDFWEVPEKKIEKDLLSVMVTCGGNDFNGLSYRIVKSLTTFNPALEIRLVINNPETIFRNSYDKQVIVYRNLSAGEMRDLMISSDIAITASGQTTYELCRTGTPFIPIITAPNQLFSIDCFYRKGLVREPIYSDDTALTEKFLAQFLCLADQELRQDLHNTMKKTISGNGSLAVVDHLLTLQKTDNDKRRN